MTPQRLPQSFWHFWMGMISVRAVPQCFCFSSKAGLKNGQPYLPSATIYCFTPSFFQKVIFSLDYFSKLFYCMTPQILRQTNPYKSSKFSECLKNASNNEIKIVLCKTPKRYHLEDYAFQNRIGLLDCSFSEPTKFTQDNEISK